MIINSTITCRYCSSLMLPDMYNELDVFECINPACRWTISEDTLQFTHGCSCPEHTGRLPEAEVAFCSVRAAWVVWFDGAIYEQASSQDDADAILWYLGRIHRLVEQPIEATFSSIPITYWSSQSPETLDYSDTLFLSY